MSLKDPKPRSMRRKTRRVAFVLSKPAVMSVDQPPDGPVGSGGTSFPHPFFLSDRRRDNAVGLFSPDVVINVKPMP